MTQLLCYRFLHTGNEKICPQKDLYMNILNNFIHNILNSQKLEAIFFSFK